MANRYVYRVIDNDNNVCLYKYVKKLARGTGEVGYLDFDLNVISSDEHCFLNDTDLEKFLMISDYKRSDFERLAVDKWEKLN